MAGLRYDPDDESANDVLLAQRRLRIGLKGGDETWVPVGKKAAAIPSVPVRPGAAVQCWCFAQAADNRW